MLIRLFFIGSVILFCQSQLVGQDKPSNKRRDGIYLGYEELINNNPSLALENVAGFRNETSQICLSAEDQYDILKENHLDLKDIWGFTINGRTYVQLRRPLYSSDTKNIVCFYKLIRLEALSIFVTEKKPPTVNARSFPLVLVVPPPNTDHSRIIVEEFIYELKTGRAISITNEYHSIVEILKSDSRMSNVRIKRKNIVNHIYEYNKLNPLTIEHGATYDEL